MNAAISLIEGLTSTEPAIVDRGRSTSAAQIRDRALALARWMVERGVKPGDRALMLVPPGADFASTLLGLCWIGATPVLLEPNQAPGVWAERILACDPQWVIVDPKVRVVWWVPGLVGWLQGRGIPVPDRPMRGTILALPGKVRGEVPAAPRLPGDTALLLFTSGTTNNPRGVLHTHGNLPMFLDHVTQTVRGLEVGSYLAETPQQIFYALLMGATCHLARGRGERRRQNTLEMLQSKGIRAWFGSPWTWAGWLREQAPIPPELQTILLGSAPVTRPFLRRLIARLPDHVQVRCVYGLSEVGPTCLIDGREKADRATEGDRVGRPISGIRLRLEASEIQIASPSLAGRYMNGEPTRPWLSTGDLGRLDGEELVLLGRKKDMILRHGINLYPGLYEPLVLARSGIEDVALIGVYDGDDDDERVVLAYVGDPPTDLAGLLGEAAPDYVMKLEALPRSGRQNKIDRKTLREMARVQFKIRPSFGLRGC